MSMIINVYNYEKKNFFEKKKKKFFSKKFLFYNFKHL